MPAKRDVLALLSRDELLAATDRFELSPHLQHRAHDRAFWEAVGRWLPDYEDRKARLRELGPSLVC
jgi:hypothetical protein